MASRMCCTAAPGWSGDGAVGGWWYGVLYRTLPAGYSWGKVGSARGRGLDELDQHAARVLGVDEVDAAVGRAAARGVVQEAQAARPQHVGDVLDVVDAE